MTLVQRTVSLRCNHYRGFWVGRVCTDVAVKCIMLFGAGVTHCMCSRA